MLPYCLRSVRTYNSSPKNTGSCFQKLRFPLPPVKAEYLQLLLDPILKTDFKLKN